MKKNGKSTKASKAVAIKRKLEPPRRDVAIQTDAVLDNLSLVTGDEPHPKYWRKFAEAKQQMIENLIADNEKLLDRIEILEQENRLLESMVEDAKLLADFVSSLPEDPDESGIEKD